MSHRQTNGKDKFIQKEDKTTEKKFITPRGKDYSQWYLDVIAAAELADSSSVRGCMVIRPNGYAIWENMQAALDAMFKQTGVRNAYFPVFIPMSFLNREAEHVRGFAKEVAIVTHHRLEAGEDGKLRPAGKLEEPLIVRPTSETIMYDSYAKWISSYRDLPLLINQWANIVRWEMRTRPFLRTTEFLWQEGHTAHATKKEADKRTKQMLGVYKKFVEEYMALPVIAGYKSEAEKFAGAVYTVSIEAMMQDKKALQSGTSHLLGQNFAKVFDVDFLDKKGERQYVWQTSWGVSTRLIGALIMAHSDDKGLVLPPKLAPTQVVILPISSSPADAQKVNDKAKTLAKELTGAGIRVEVDERDMRAGVKFFEWEKMGVPIRLEVGPKDIAAKSVVLVRRDTSVKQNVAEKDLPVQIGKMLNTIQKDIYDKALAFREKNTKQVNSWEEFTKMMNDGGGFALAHWCQDGDCEAKIQEETKATIRVIPFDAREEKGKCVRCGGQSSRRVVIAKAY